MAYSIFAAGTGHYRMNGRRQFRDEGDIYDLADLYGKAAEKTKSNLGGLSGDYKKAVQALGKSVTYGTLRGAVADMALLRGPYIDLMVHSKGTLWGIWDAPWYRQDTCFLSGNSFDDKTVDMLKCMKRCRINRWGIVLGVAEVISDYTAHLARTSAQPDPAALRLDISV